MIALLLFLILNFILFIPLYYFNKETSNIFPFKAYIEDGKFKIRRIFFNVNRDFFKLNLEFSTLVFALTFCKSFLPYDFSVVLISIVYFFSLVLFYYHYSIYSIYDTYPAIYGDFNLIKQGINTAYSGYKKFLYLGIILFGCFTYVLSNLIDHLVTLIYASETTLLQLISGLVIAVIILFSIRYKTNLFLFESEIVFFNTQHFIIQSTTRFILSNSHFNTNIREYIAAIPKLVNDSKVTTPTSVSLKKKPNIYFISIESYGAILYENKVHKNKYKTLLTEIEEGLIKNKFYLASRLSKSPVTAGGSWMAFSSFLNGIEIKTDALYRNLISKQKEYPIQSVFNILNDFGYNSYFIGPLGGFESFKINWEELLEFQGTRNVIKYKDLEYKGVQFNWGPSAPDQYMLNKSIQIMKEKYPNQPISFFVETINSHYNFHSPTQVFPKWEECNHASLESFNPTTDLKANLVDNYFSAIKYQLKTIEDLILNEPSDTIFVLFGDHQPPLITNQNNSYKTPLHIISKDKEFIQEFYSQGFSNSLKVTNYPEDSDFKHNDFKKHFMAVFLKTYQNEN